VEISWHTNPSLCWSVAGDAGYYDKDEIWQDGAGHALQLWSCSASPATFLVPSSSKGTIKWAQNPDLCLDWKKDGPRWRLCTKVSTDDTQFEFDMAAEGCGTVGVLPEGRQCVGAQSSSGGNGGALSLLDCNTPMTNSLYFCLPRSALVQMRAAALLSGPSTYEKKQKKKDKKDLKLAKPGKFLYWQAQPNICVGIAYDQPGTGNGNSLQLWDCAKCEDHFTLPPNGEPGMIHWAENPDFCLDSPEDPTDPTVLQLWLCNVTPPEHKNFSIWLGAGSDGTIRQSHNNDSCISLPEGQTDIAAHLIMRTCNSSDQNFRFSFGDEVQTTTRPTSGEQVGNGFAVGSAAQEDLETSANATVTTWVTLVCIACSVALFLFLCCLTCASMR